MRARGLDGQALRHRDGESRRLPRGAAPRRVRLHARVPGGALLPRRAAVDDRVGDVRGHAGDHREEALVSLPLLYTHVMGSHGFPGWFWTALDRIKAGDY